MFKGSTLDWGGRLRNPCCLLFIHNQNMAFRVIPLLTIAIAHHYSLGLWVDSSQEPEKRYHNSIKAEETLDVISKVSKWQK